MRDRIRLFVRNSDDCYRRSGWGECGFHVARVQDGLASSPMAADSAGVFRLRIQLLAATTPTVRYLLPAREFHTLAAATRMTREPRNSSGQKWLKGRCSERRTTT